MQQDDLIAHILICLSVQYRSGEQKSGALPKWVGYDTSIETTVSYTGLVELYLSPKRFNLIYYPGTTDPAYFPVLVGHLVSMIFRVL